MLGKVVSKKVCHRNEERIIRDREQATRHKAQGSLKSKRAKKFYKQYGHW